MFVSKYSAVFLVSCFIGIYFICLRQYEITYSFKFKNYADPFNNSNETISTKRYLSSRLASKSRLGNHLYELTSLVGIARFLNRTPVFFIEDASYRKELDVTNETIPGLIDQFLIVNSSVPSNIRDTVFHTRCCIYQDPRVLENIGDEHIHLTGTLYQSYKYFRNMRDEVLSWVRKPSSKFTGLPQSDESTHITCVHTSRGDFVGYGLQASDDHFIREAVKYIQKEENPKNQRKVVVIFGDDANFMKKIFNDTVPSREETIQNSTTTYFISGNSPTDDILYSRSNCDVALLSASHSSFGWWIGYVSKYNKVYHMDIRVHYVGALKGGRMNIVDYYPPNWTPLKFSSDNKTIIIGDKPAY